MNFKSLITNLFVLLPYWAMCQNLVRIKDKRTSLPLSFTSIKIPNQGKETMANEKGEIRLHYSAGDTLIFSHVGYVSSILTAMDTVVYLIPRDIPLKEVTISRKYLRTIKLSDEANKISDGWKDTGISFASPEIAQKFTLPKSENRYKLKDIEIPVYKWNCWSDIIVHLYEMRPTDSLPGEEFWSKLITVNKKSIKKGKLILNMGNEDINFLSSDQFFLSVTWDSDQQKNCKTCIYLEKTLKANYWYRCKTCVFRESSTKNVSNFYVWFGGTKYFLPSSPHTSWFAQMFAEVKLDEFGN